MVRWALKREGVGGKWSKEGCEGQIRGEKGRGGG